MALHKGPNFWSTNRCLPHLEYAAVAWDPNSKEEINALELVQNQAEAARYIAGLKGMRGIKRGY